MSILDILGAGILLSSLSQDGGAWNDDVGKKFYGATKEVIDCGEEGMQRVNAAVQENANRLAFSVNGLASKTANSLKDITSSADSAYAKISSLDPNVYYERSESLKRSG